MTTMHQLRCSASFSYNATLSKEELDMTKKEHKSLAPSKRSMIQAFYMMHHWLTMATEEHRVKRRRVD